MKNRLIISILTLSLIMTTITLPSFAETAGGDSKSIQTADQLKAEMAVYMKDGRITESERKVLLENTTKEAVADLISEKLDAAVERLNSDETVTLRSLADGTAYAIEEYDLGDGCVLSVELEDCAEGVEKEISIMPMATSGSSEMWKDYGNRYFTATATVDCKVGSIRLSLENHYKLSSSGIDENKGVSDGILKNIIGSITRKTPQITDGVARTPGASDVNMYCEYTVKIIDGKTTDDREYRLDTTVKYLSHDKTGKRIKVGHAWNLTRVS